METVDYSLGDNPPRDIVSDGMRIRTVEDIQRYHFCVDLSQRAPCRRSGYTMTYRKIEVNHGLDQAAKAMVASALSASLRDHASVVMSIAV